MSTKRWVGDFCSRVPRVAQDKAGGQEIPEGLALCPRVHPEGAIYVRRLSYLCNLSKKLMKVVSART